MQASTFTRLLTAVTFLFTFLRPLPAQDVIALTEQGLRLMNQGRLREAEAPLLAALRIAGDANPTALYNVAALYQRQGRLQEAERLHRIALERIEQRRGPDHPELVQSLLDLGVIQRMRGRQSQAIGTLNRALSILEKSPAREMEAKVRNSLGTVYFDVGDNDQAEAMVRRALALAESAPALEGVEVAYILSNLGWGHLVRRRYEDAEAAFERTVSLLSSAFGPQHPDYAIAVGNLGIVHRHQGRFREALPLLERSIAVLDRIAEPNAGALAVLLENYSAVLRRLGRKSEAVEAAKRTKAIGRPGAGTVDVKALRHY